jgi:CxxC motif-containing protein
MKNKHEFLCINCPIGCTLELSEEDGEILEIAGAECKVGEKYAEEEFRNPRRMVSTTVRVTGGALQLLPVVSASPIPKKMVREAVRVLADVVVKAPVADGQVIYPDIMGTGVDVVSSRKLERATTKVAPS